MSDSKEGWTLVSSDGDVMSQSVHSDSSESSIEVVEVDGEHVFSRSISEKQDLVTVSTKEEDASFLDYENEASVSENLQEEECTHDSAEITDSDCCAEDDVCEANQRYRSPSTVSQDFVDESTENVADIKEDEVIPEGVSNTGAAAVIDVTVQSSSFESKERPDAAVDLLPLRADEASGDEPQETRQLDTDQDFVCLEPESLPENHENIEEQVVDRHLNPFLLRSQPRPSIDANFNFFRQEQVVGRMEDREEDVEPDDDDDTESSTEESIYDRIESEQSQANLLHFGQDVGDLSAFADIGDIPLGRGNVARNYIHQPNNHLSTILNAAVVLVGILIIGISVGILVANDLEIEEWQTAYEVKARKVENLKLKLLEADTLIKQYKDQLSSFEEIVSLTSKNEELKVSPAVGFLRNVQLAVNAFSGCKKETLYKTPDACKNDVSNYMKTSFDDLKASFYKEKEREKEEQSIYKPQITEAKPLPSLSEDSQINAQEATETKPSSANENIRSETETVKAEPVPIDVKQLQQSVTREQERALHWQQLYLAERRQREKEHDEELLEDERDKANEKNVHFECLQKLINLNVTDMAKQAMTWNVSLFDDFANLSMLMSSVAQLKQSLVDSVLKTWEDTENTIKTYREYNKEDNSKYFDKEIVVNYLKNILSDLKTGVDDILIEVDGGQTEGKQSQDQTEHENSDYEEIEKPTFRRKWARSIGKIFKKTGKAFRNLGQSVTKTFKRFKSLFFKNSKNFQANKNVKKQAEIRLKHENWAADRDMTAFDVLFSEHVVEQRISLQKKQLKRCQKLHRKKQKCNVNTDGIHKANENFKNIVKNAGRIEDHIYPVIKKFISDGKNKHIFLSVDLNWLVCIINDDKRRNRNDKQVALENCLNNLVKSLETGKRHGSFHRTKKEFKHKKLNSNKRRLNARDKKEKSDSMKHFSAHKVLFSESMIKRRNYHQKQLLNHCSKSNCRFTEKQLREINKQFKYLVENIENIQDYKRFTLVKDFLARYQYSNLFTAADTQWLVCMAKNYQLMYKFENGNKLKENCLRKLLQKLNMVSWYKKSDGKLDQKANSKYNDIKTQSSSIFYQKEKSDPSKSEDFNNEESDFSKLNSTERDTEINYKDKDWYLERGRYRIELRRSFVSSNIGDFDKSEPYGNTWMLARAQNRQMLREKEHRSDWLFERARDRRKGEKEYPSSSYCYHNGCSDNWYLKQAKAREEQRASNHRAESDIQKEKDRRKEWDFEEAVFTVYDWD